jgi:hypothetical protein
MDNFEQNIITMIVESFFLVKMPHRLGDDVNFGVTRMLAEAVELTEHDNAQSRNGNISQSSSKQPQRN